MERSGCAPVFLLRRWLFSSQEIGKAFRFAQDTGIVSVIWFEQVDAPVDRLCVEDDREARALLMRIDAADARPIGFTRAGCAFDGVGDENGIVGHRTSFRCNGPAVKR